MFFRFLFNFLFLIVTHGQPLQVASRNSLCAAPCALPVNLGYPKINIQLYSLFLSHQYIYIYITIYFKYRAKIKVSSPLQVVECLRSNTYIFVLDHSLQLKLSAMDSYVSLLSFSMRFCMEIFNPHRVIHLYVDIATMAEVGMGWLDI